MDKSMKKPENKEVTRHVRLESGGALTPQGKGFEVMAITAGEGNGWFFDARILRESLPLWDGVECFIDHHWQGHSLRDLAGVFSRPRWEEAQQGVLLDLMPVGPAGSLLEGLGQQLLADEQAAKPRVGFSADVVFTAQGKRVQRIQRVLSVDLVYHPARGGAFVRALNAAGDFRPEIVVTGRQEQADFISKEGFSMKGMKQKEEAVLQDETEKKQEPLSGTGEGAELRRQMCAYLLESGLAAAGLPKPLETQIRKRFDNRVFDPQELNEAIADERKLLSDLQGPSVVAGTGQISGMVTSEEMLQCAVDDLFGVKRDAGLEGVHAHKLSGIKELYMRMTGDHHLHGGYYPERVQLATTSTMANLVANVMNKVVVEQWERLGRAGYDWWKRVVSIEHFSSLQQIKGILLSEVGLLPSVNEGAAYQELPIDDSGETADWSKYGGYLPLTLELIDRDETRVLAQYPRKLASAAMRRISYEVAQVFTGNSGVGPTMSDGYALFAPQHTNLGTDALSADSWENACKAVYNQSMLVASGETAPKLALEPRYLVVPRALRQKARGILVPVWDRAANVHSENLYRLDEDAVVVCPEFSDATDWAAVTDPALAPAIVVAERFGLMPEIFVAGGELSPAMFTNDESRLKVRHFLAVAVVDYRPLYKANVAD